MTSMQKILAASYRFEVPLPEMTRQNTEFSDLQTGL